MNTYHELFIQAIKRTVALGCEIPCISFETTTFLKEPSVILKELEDLLGGPDNTELLVSQCLPIHTTLLPRLEKVLNTDIYFTIGSVSYQNSKWFTITEEEIIGYLNNGMPFKSQIHAWLTLPSMEIIDVTLLKTYTYANKLEEKGAGIIMDHSSAIQNRGLNYIHPYDHRA